MYDIVPFDREDFMQALFDSDPAEDKFAKTFRAKADMLKLWDEARGIFIDGELAAAIAIRLNKRQPVANLQLLHTFNRFRRRGLARCLTLGGFASAYDSGGAGYFRVSSERPALAFYRALGFTFWGEQKSGCELSIFRINGPEITDGVYDPEDSVIRSAVFTKARGGVVKLHEGGPL